LFEGLPKEWRELLEMQPQRHEIDCIDESLKINKDKIVIPDQSNNQITVYEVHPRFNGTQRSFIITATNRPDGRNGGSSSRSHSNSKEGSGGGSSDEKQNNEKQPSEETKQIYEV
jgi:hypothetical protein